jgi:hypothetical protein
LKVVLLYPRLLGPVSYWNGTGGCSTVIHNNIQDRISTPVIQIFHSVSRLSISDIPE